MQPHKCLNFLTLVKLVSLTIFIVMILLVAGCDDPPHKLVFQENFTKSKKLPKHWEVINGQWNVANNSVTGVQNHEWAVMLARYKLPKDYLLTFSARMEPGSILFEVILGFKSEKYLGLYVYEIENKIAFEDRSLFLGEGYTRERTYIRTTGNIGLLPRQNYQFNNEWMAWKIQKTGSQVFVWINNQPVIGYNDKRGLLQSNGRFGFAIKGTAQIQNVQLYKIRDQALLPPAGFESKSEREMPFVLFSE